MSIRKITNPNGKDRWRLVVDAGHHPDGRRRQITKTFDTKAEAVKAEARLKVRVDEGTFTAKSKITVSEFLDKWLEGREGIRENTRAGYKADLKPVYDECGHLPLQALTTDRIIDLKATMKTTGGRSGNGRSVRSINLTLTLLGMAMESAVRQRLLPFNPAHRDLVERVKGSDSDKPKFDAWNVEQVQAFLKQITGDRYEAAWRLTMLGMRRSEVLGLRWDNVDLDAGTVTIAESRTPRRGKDASTERTPIGAPKTDNSKRTIPVPPEVTAALKAFKKRQNEERMALGAKWLNGDEHVVVDEVGFPISPEWYRALFLRHRDAAGLPQIRLHDCRRTAATLLAMNPDIVDDAAASYLGHSTRVFHDVYVVGEKGHGSVAAALGQMQTGTLG